MLRPIFPDVPQTKLPICFTDIEELRPGIPKSMRAIGHKESSFETRTSENKQIGIKQYDNHPNTKAKTYLDCNA